MWTVTIKTAKPPGERDVWDSREVETWGEVDTLVKDAILNGKGGITIRQNKRERPHETSSDGHG